MAGVNSFDEINFLIVGDRGFVIGLFYCMLGLCLNVKVLFINIYFSKLLKMMVMVILFVE